MKNVLVFDCETSGLDRDHDEVIEVGYVLWSVEHRTVLECYSAVLSGDGNAAELFNAIPPGARSFGTDPEIAWTIAGQAAQQADLVLAHQADFDRAFVWRAASSFETSTPYDGAADLLKLRWVCTIEDFLWPIVSASKSLVSIALAHGVAVTSAHRAINDCLLLARLLERVDHVDDLLHLALQRASRPKAEFIARTPYQQKDLVKAAGFHWNGTVWSRYMAVEDAEKLPFEVVTVDKAIEEARA
jgi:DNA polymerase-3 subunit epsilon